MFCYDVDDQHANAFSDDPRDHCLKMFACYTWQADSTHPEQFLRSSACMMNKTTGLSYQIVLKITVKWCCWLWGWYWRHCMLVNVILNSFRRENWCIKDLSNVFLMKWKNNKMRHDHGAQRFIIDTGAESFDFMIMGAVCSSLYITGWSLLSFGQWWVNPMQQGQRIQWWGRPKGLIILFWSTALKWIDKDRDDDEFRALMQYCADSVAGQIISLGKQYRPIRY